MDISTKSIESSLKFLKIRTLCIILICIYYKIEEVVFSCIFFF